jgi:very-short-patch-repair endonuclease
MPLPVSPGEKLDEARKELLDLGLRNPLISYARSKARGASVVDELPAEIFRILLVEGKPMYFDPAPDGEEDRDELLIEQPEEAAAGPAANHLDNRLQTPYTSALLQKRLLNTFYTARTFLEEQGISVLYLALGMLEWYEAPSSDRKRIAPLILVPVDLERANIQSKFRLRANGDEIVTNLSLQAKLKLEFGIALPEIPAQLEDLDVAAYFAAVEEVIGHQRRWAVDRRATELGFFSFGKFLMYNDLDVRRWPEEGHPDRHEVLRALLEEGFDEPDGRLPDDARLDDILPPDRVHHIVDADSTQILALIDANDGYNLVIQGPPGTGKSQTITNIIAEAMARGRRVLFVSEKMAALEVVKRRLDRLGLGDACLEVHSHKTNKKSLLDELRRTLQLGRPRTSANGDDIQHLALSRARLNAYAEAVNAPVGESRLSPFGLYGRLLALQRQHPVSWPVLERREMRTWPAARFTMCASFAGELQSLLAKMGMPREHPFRGCMCRAVTPAERQGLIEEAGRALEHLRGLEQLSAAAATAGGLAVPETPAEVAVLCNGLERVAGAPDLTGVELDEAWWGVNRERVAAVLESLARHLELRAAYDEMLIPEAWTRDVLAVRRDLLAYGDAWYRMAVGAYRTARNELRGLCRAALPETNEGRLALVDAIMEAQRHRTIVSEGEEFGRRAFGTQWRGMDSNAQTLKATASWLAEVHADIRKGVLPQGTIELLARRDPQRHLERDAQAIRAEADALASAATAVDARLQVDAAARFPSPEPFPKQRLDAQASLFEAAIGELDRLQEMVSYNHLVEAIREADFPFVVETAESWPASPRLLVAAIEYNWYNELLRAALAERPALGAFDGGRHATEVGTFQRLDELSFAHNRAMLVERHWSQLPAGGASGQMGVLRREFEKKRRHLPIRSLIHEAGAAIQTIKPVFMMSPMSIAAYLAPGSVAFDMVVFDEASQVKPVEAFGAILRGRQTIVVGDSRQLPPTSFFDSVTADSLMDTDDEALMASADVESVLGLFCAKGAPERMLRWHYRSRHESLITVSNREFYDGRLVTFPSPQQNGGDLGLRYHHLPDTVYERGSSRANRGEARAVAGAVMRHAEAAPHHTLGVAAFSQAQAEAIQNQLEVYRRDNPGCEAFFAAHPEEPFFVKNLENVQGDERDVILISIGYGRDEHGKLTMNFGPLNRDGGERRLNVLITRARRRCEVFTNLLPDDINIGPTSPRGLMSLRRYLSYARTGTYEHLEPSDRYADSPFETEVAAAVRALGYEVQLQVGSAGYFVDLAVVDPDHPGSFLLGIECDGATYHRARSARDRDRIRQAVLEGLGWKLHRIWSTDWFNNAPREQARLLAAIEEAVARRRVGGDGHTAPPILKVELIEREPESEAAPVSLSAEPYIVAKLPRGHAPHEGLHMESPTRLAKMLQAVVDVESPVHMEEAMKRVLDAYGVTRLGVRIRERMLVAISLAARNYWLREDGDFLVNPNQADTLVRDRSTLDASSRRIGLVAPAELQAAILRVVAASVAINPGDVAGEVCTLLGFGRTTGDMRTAIEEQVEALIERQQLRANGHQLTAVG